MKKVPVFILILLSFSLIGKNIKYSKHNLSFQGRGTIKSSSLNEICVFCHTTHNRFAAAPSWNRELGQVIYSTYDSSTLYSLPGQPDGASKLCLSCHDGTIALASMGRSQEGNLMNVSGLNIPAHRTTHLGTDLSDDHPVSFQSSAAVAAISTLKHPFQGDRVTYDKNEKIHCTTCHDSHDETFSPLLVKNDVNGGLC